MQKEKNTFQTKSQFLNTAWINFSSKDLAWTTSLIIAVIVSPIITGHTAQNQWINGSIVNAILFIAAYRLGVLNNIIIATLPSSVVLMRGLLPAPMAIMIPVIIVSNIILMAIFSKFKNRLFFGGILASIVKFAFLASIANLLSFKLTKTMLVMMTWPQLYTALAGMLIAIAIIKKFKVQSA